MKLDRVLERLRALASESLAEPWDHVGLQVGDPDRPVRKALLCIDLTDAVLEEAVAKKASLIVAYHPPIFSPLEAVTTQHPKQRVIYHAVRRGIAIYSPHTALDAATGGVNDWLCDGLGPGRRRPIRPHPPATLFKLVVFIPHAQADRLRAALSSQGAGVIGDYTQCSFGTDGTGTFKGGRATNPTIGRRGRFETVSELRMEMVCPSDRLSAVVAALHRDHPYEEPAYDLYRLEPTPAQPSGSHPPSTGQGRVLTLDQPVTLKTLIQRAKNHLGVDHLDVSAPSLNRRVQVIGLCAGVGGALVSEAGRIDAFLTGEMRHHDVLAAAASGTVVLLAGHTQTERGYLPVYRKRILAAGGGKIQWLVSRSDQPPSKLV